MTRKTSAIAIIPVVWIAGLLSLAPAGAQADTYCVAPAACTNNEPTLQAALNAVGGHAGADTIVLGATTYAQDGLNASVAGGPVEIDGAGPGQTIITSATTPAAGTFMLNVSAPVALTLRNLGVEVKGTTDTGAIHAAGTIDAQDVAITTSGTLPGAEGIQDDGGGRIADASISLPGADDCLVLDGGVSITNLTTSGCGSAINDQGGTPVTVRDSVLQAASFGVEVGGGGSALVEDSVIRLGAGAVGALFVTSYGSFVSSITARQITAITAGGAGLFAGNNGGPASSASVTLSDSIVRGPVTPESRSSTGTGTATITASHDDIATTGSASSGPGTLTNSATVDVDPLFVSSTDAHLQAGSPVLDRDPAPLLPDEQVIDFDGNPRIVNGARDYGAFERTVAPVPSAPTVNPVGPTTGNRAAATIHARLSHLAISPKRVTAGHSARLSYTIEATPGATLPATLTVSVSHIVHGHRRGSTCSVAARHGRGCTVTRIVYRTSHRVVAGPGHITLPARPAGHALAPGVYTVHASDGGPAATVRFTVVRRQRRGS